MFEGGSEQNLQGNKWRPAADLFEGAAAYVLQLELPGMDRDAVCLELRPPKLVVYGERRMLRSVQPGAYRLVERCYGPFARSFTLPEDADLNSITADMADGVLTVTLPRMQDSGPRRIEVKAE